MDEHKSILDNLGFSYKPHSLYANIIDTIYDAAEKLSLPEHLKLLLAEPKNELMIHFPVRMDNGSYRLFRDTASNIITCSAPIKAAYGMIRPYHSTTSKLLP